MLDIGIELNRTVRFHHFHYLDGTTRDTQAFQVVIETIYINLSGPSGDFSDCRTLNHHRETERSEKRHHRYSSNSGFLHQIQSHPSKVNWNHFEYGPLRGKSLVTRWKQQHEQTVSFGCPSCIVQILIESIYIHLLHGTKDIQRNKKGLRTILATLTYLFFSMSQTAKSVCRLYRNILKVTKFEYYVRNREWKHIPLQKERN